MPQPFLNPKTPHVIQKAYYLLNFFSNTKTIHRSKNSIAVFALKIYMVVSSPRHTDQ